MTEQTFKQTPMSGDAVSQLVQLLVKEIGLKNFKATGKGDADIRSVVTRAFNSDLGRQELWNMTSDFLKLIDETPGLPESFLATVSAGVLRARACVDIGQKT
jgi:hypothetical protein